MESSTKRHSSTQCDNDVPLQVGRPRTRGGQFIVSKYHITATLADIIAEAAGLGGSEVRS